MKMKIFLIGGFRETNFLAKSLIKKGYRVTAINDDMHDCQELAKIDDLMVFHGDGSKPFVLEDANIYNADIAIALTKRDDDNLVICELCKKKFNVKKTVAIISDPIKTEFFYRMGIDSVVCAITTISGIIEQQALMDEMETLVAANEDRIKIAEVYISTAAPAVNKKIWEINLPQKVIIGCILRGDKSMIPHGDTRILSGDILVLISSDENETKAINELTGGEGK